MKVSLRKNKVLLINTILLFVSFVVFFSFLLITNYLSEGRFSILTVLFSNIEGILRDLGSISDFISGIFCIIVPAILIVISCVYIIIMFIVVIKENKQIKYSSLIIWASIYLVTIIYVYIFELIWFSIEERLKPALSLIMLIPVMIFALYNLVSTIVLYMRGTKTIKTNA